MPEGFQDGDQRFIGELSWTLERHPELEQLMVMFGDRCWQEFIQRAECKPTPLRSLGD